MSDERPLVLHLSSLGGGGAESVLFRLVTHDYLFRHHVVALTGLEYYGRLLVDEGIPVTTLDLPRGKLRLGALIKLWRLLRAERPFVFQTWMYHSDLIGGLIARATLMQNVIWNIRHSSLDPVYNSHRTLAVAKINAKLSRVLPKRIVCCGTAALLAHKKLGYDDRRMVVIPNGYDLSQLYPDPEAGLALRRELRIPAEGLVLGMVGRFAPEKDHGNLLAALALVAARGVDFTLLLVGSGLDTTNAQLVTMIARHGLTEQTRLLGPRRDIRAVMSSLDLHLLSSCSEGFPNVVAEAMACGTMPIATRAGDAAEIVGDSGWLCPTRDPSALADAVLMALQARMDPEGWQARRLAARERVDRMFSLDVMVDRYVDLWSSC